MRLAKRSNAFNRIYNKSYKFNYISYMINSLLRKGFKLFSFFIIYKFLFIIKLKYQKSVTIILNDFFNNYIPLYSFISKKISANVYSLPWPIKKERAQSLLVQWFIQSSLQRSESQLIMRSVNEFNDLSIGVGKTVFCFENHYLLMMKNRPFMRFLRPKRSGFLNRLKKYGIK